MARIDSLLSIVVAQGANELRLGVDREPKMLASGAAKRLALPATSEGTLRDLLDGLLDPAREQAMRAGRVEFTYDAPGLGTFQVRATPRGDAFDVVFLRAGVAARAQPAREVPPPATSAPMARPALERAAVERPPVVEAAPHAESDALAQLVAAAAALRASDLHLADGQEPMARVDGVLQRLGYGPSPMAALLRLDAAQEQRLAAGHATDFAADVDGVGRVRVHAFRTAAGLCAAIRLLPGTAPSLASLHMPMPLADLVEFPHGLVLVGGATGSGKSTTLAALAQEALRKHSLVLTTLEDPIEYALASSQSSIVRRRQVGVDVGDFATGLRDALREDPDVVLVGEMRDAATIDLVLTAAETGHLVLSSLHCRSAASAIERIVDAAGERGPQVRAQLAESLRVVVVQHLLPRSQGRGRLPVIEVLRVNHAVSALIREGKAAQLATALQSGKRDGMLALERCLADRVQAGEISLNDARAVANDPATLEMFLARS
jgi:twitching motility protein PilT